MVIFRISLCMVIFLLIACARMPEGYKSEDFVEADYSIIEDASYINKKYNGQLIYVAEEKKISDDIYFVNVGIKSNNSGYKISSEDKNTLDYAFNKEALLHCNYRQYNVKPTMFKQAKPGVILYTFDYYFYKLGTVVCKNN